MSVRKVFNRLMKVQETNDQQAYDGTVGRGRSTDEAPKAAAEVTEGRSEPEGNALESPTTETPSSEPVSSGLQRVRQAAAGNGQELFTALLHHVTVDLLEEAYRKLNPHAAVGMDQVTWLHYGEGLRANIDDLSKMRQYWHGLAGVITQRQMPTHLRVICKRYAICV